MGSFMPWALNPLGNHWIGGWVGPTTGVDHMEEWKFLTLPWLELQPLGRPARSQSVYWPHYRGSHIKYREIKIYVRNLVTVTEESFFLKLEVLIIASFGMLRRMALVRTDVSEERSASFIRVTRIGELGTTLAVTSNRRTIRNVGLYKSYMA
jgi:hypothetical protein